MLGRKVGERLARPAHQSLAAAVKEIAGGADLFIANLECCISDRGAPVREPGKPFYFRAPPVAAERLAEIGVNCVSLANNHALDFGSKALQDTLDHLRAAGIAVVAQAAMRPRHGRRWCSTRVGCACGSSRSVTIQHPTQRACSVPGSLSPIWRAHPSPRGCASRARRTRTPT